MRGNIAWKIFIAIMVFPSLVFASKAPDDFKKTKILDKAYRIRIPFIENRGQIESDNVSFYAKTFGGTLFVERDGTLTYSLTSKDRRSVVIKEVLTGKEIKIEGLEPSPTRISYFKGNDKTKWKSNIPSYGSITLGEVYEGIELTLRAYGNNVEKLFTVLPGENPETIKIKLQGAKGLEVNEAGELELITELGPVKFTKPVAYQEIDGKRIEIAAAYSIQNSAKIIPQSAIQNPKSYSYGFKIGDFNKDYPLIIDPLLASTFIGGGGADKGYSIALDVSGNIYVVGETADAVTDYPVTAGVHDLAHNGGNDVFVTKLNSIMTTLLASTYIGGSGNDAGKSIALDGSANVYVVGETADAGTDYPVTAGVHDLAHNGNNDVFVTKLDSILTTLSASTLIGGTGDDYGRSIALAGENVYLAGYAGTAYPTTAGAHDEIHNGDNDVFVTKLDSILTSLWASTFIGGSGNDAGRSIALDGSQNVYVTGEAESGYPTAGNPYDSSHNNNKDVFVSKLNGTLTNLSASTFIGGSGNDTGYSIALDGSQNVYVTGEAVGGYPITSGVHDESYNAGIDVFVSKLDSMLSTGTAGAGTSSSSSTITSTSTSTSTTASTTTTAATTTAGPTTTTVPSGTTTSSSLTTTTVHANAGTIIIYNYCKLCEDNLDISVTNLLAGYKYEGLGNISCFGCSADFYDVPPGLISIKYECQSGGESEEETFRAGKTVLLLPRRTMELNYSCIVEEIKRDLCPSLQIYGEHSEEVKLLRYYSDNVLSTTPEGQEIIKLYYEWRPVIATMIEEDEEFRSNVKELIDEALKLFKEDRRIDPLLINEVK